MSEVHHVVHLVRTAPRSDIAVFFVCYGPLFFGAAHKALKIISTIDPSVRGVVLDLSGVPVMHATGMVNIRSLVDSLKQRGVKLYLYSVQDRIRSKLERFGLGGAASNCIITNDLSVVE